MPFFEAIFHFESLMHIRLINDLDQFRFYSDWIGQGFMDRAFIGYDQQPFPFLGGQVSYEFYLPTYIGRIGIAIADQAECDIDPVEGHLFAICIHPDGDTGTGPQGRCQYLMRVHALIPSPIAGRLIRDDGVLTGCQYDTIVITTDRSFYICFTHVLGFTVMESLALPDESV